MSTSLTWPDCSAVGQQNKQTGNATSYDHDSDPWDFPDMEL